MSTSRSSIRLLLGDQRLAGRLNATATISGSTKQPRVEGEFTLSQGAFRQFMFESLAGQGRLLSAAG